MIAHFLSSVLSDLAGCMWYGQMPDIHCKNQHRQKQCLKKWKLQAKLHQQTNGTASLMKCVSVWNPWLVRYLLIRCALWCKFNLQIYTLGRYHMSKLSSVTHTKSPYWPWQRISGSAKHHEAHREGVVQDNSCEKHRHIRHTPAKHCYQHHFHIVDTTNPKIIKQLNKLQLHFWHCREQIGPQYWNNNWVQ